MTFVYFGYNTKIFTLMVLIVTLFILYTILFIFYIYRSDKALYAFSVITITILYDCAT